MKIFTKSGMASLIILVLCVCFATTPRADDSGNYYCNVYIGDVCFAISRGDVLTMKIPADFVLYNVKLRGAESVQVYYGHNPEGVEEDDVLIKSGSKSGIYEFSVYRKNESHYRILYKREHPKINKVYVSFVDIDMTGVDDVNYQIFNDFLYTFTHCSQVGDKGVSCDENKKSVFGDKILEKEMFTKQSGRAQ